MGLSLILALPSAGASELMETENDGRVVVLDFGDEGDTGLSEFLAAAEPIIGKVILRGDDALGKKVRLHGELRVARMRFEAFVEGIAFREGLVPIRLESHLALVSRDHEDLRRLFRASATRVSREDLPLYEGRFIPISVVLPLDGLSTMDAMDRLGVAQTALSEPGLEFVRATTDGSSFVVMGFANTVVSVAALVRDLGSAVVGGEESSREALVERIASLEARIRSLEESVLELQRKGG